MKHADWGDKRKTRKKKEVETWDVFLLAEEELCRPRNWCVMTISTASFLAHWFLGLPRLTLDLNYTLGFRGTSTTMQPTRSLPRSRLPDLISIFLSLPFERYSHEIKRQCTELIIISFFFPTPLEPPRRPNPRPAQTQSTGSPATGSDFPKP